MDTENLRQLIIKWYKNSSADRPLINDSFDSFISLWIAFNAWGRYQTDEEEKDSEMIKKLVKERKLIESFNSAKQIKGFVNKINQFKGYEIPTHRQRPRFRSFNDENDFERILWFIYTVRCNLFHGRKDRSNAYEKELVEWATYVLRHIFTILKDRSDFMEKAD